MRPPEFKLSNPPEDLISAVKFGPKSNQYMAASSWDGTLRFYDVAANQLRQKFLKEAPILDCAFMVGRVLTPLHASQANPLVSRTLFTW